jgi:hypothetical protein
MKIDEQSTLEVSSRSERDEHQDPSSQEAVHRRVSSAQLKLAKFIFEREVAEFVDVVRAIEMGECQKVDEWKAEAQRKGPPVIEWALPKCTFRTR